LQISLDGDPVMTRDFQAGDNGSNGQQSNKFAGRYGINVPAGEHTVTVENIGNDWFMVGYRFIDLVKRTGPALQGWAVAGDDTVMAWIRAEGHTWRKMIVDKVQIPSVPPSILGLEGLAAGDWTVQIWDTWKGMAVSTQAAKIGLNGRVKVLLPTISSDVAVKLTRAKPARRSK